jgi:hypothetical protein
MVSLSTSLMLQRKVGLVFSHAMQRMINSSDGLNSPIASYFIMVYCVSFLLELLLCRPFTFCLNPVFFYFGNLCCYVQKVLLAVCQYPLILCCLREAISHGGKNETGINLFMRLHSFQQNVNGL